MSPKSCSRIIGCRPWRCRSRKQAARRRCPGTSARSSCSRPRAGSTARSKGSASSEELLRRGQENRGLTRPELAVVLSVSKLVLQDAAEELAAGGRSAGRAAIVRRFPQGDAQGACRGDPRPSAAQRDYRDQGREPPRQPAGPGRRLRPDRGRRRFAAAGRRRIPRRRASARPRQIVGARSRRTACPRRCGSSFSRLPLQASARTSPTSSARPAARPASASSVRCSSRACARFRPRRPSSSAPRSATKRRPAATG